MTLDLKVSGKGRTHSRGTPTERFWAKVDRRGPDDCWLWVGRLNGGGYGSFRLGACNDVKAHRASYELLVSPIPHGMFVLHRCDVRHCVNPAHLFLGSLADNNHDRDAKGRTVIPVGEQSGMAKVSDAAALKIRVALELGADPAEVAAAFEVERSIVYNIGQERRSSIRQSAPLPATLTVMTMEARDTVRRNVERVIEVLRNEDFCEREAGRCYADELRSALALLSPTS